MVKINIPPSLTVAGLLFFGKNPQSFKPAFTVKLVSLSTHCLPFSGFGTGIKRAIKEQPNIEFENDVEGEQFKVTIPRTTL